MFWQHFNLSLRFVGRLDKELKSRRVGNWGSSWPVLFTLCFPPNDNRAKLIENFLRCGNIGQTQIKMRKVQIMQQFHFDILAKTGWKAVNVNDGPTKGSTPKDTKKKKRRQKLLITSQKTHFCGALCSCHTQTQRHTHSAAKTLVHTSFAILSAAAFVPQ